MSIDEFMEKYTSRVKRINMDDETVHQVRLDIDHQSFTLDIECGNKKHANWFRRQLAVALIRLVENESSSSV